MTSAGMRVGGAPLAGDGRRVGDVDFHQFEGHEHGEERGAHVMHHHVGQVVAQLFQLLQPLVTELQLLLLPSDRTYGENRFDTGHIESARP